MNRMSFIPGAAVREQIENADGRIFFGRDCARDFAQEYIAKAPSGLQPILYQTVLACLSIGDMAEIQFGLREPTSSEEVDPTGELIGHTWATLTEANGNHKLLWEVGRRTELVRSECAVKAFNGYRNALAAFNGVSEPPELPVSIPASAAMPPARAGTTIISRALSPSNLYFASGLMFYFVDLATSTPSDSDYLTNPLILSRPMPAFDALILSTLLTLVLGSPPLVFAVVQARSHLGEVPMGFERTSYAHARDLDQVENEISIVL